MNKLKEINGKFYQEAEVVMLATDKKATDKPFTVGITLCNDCKLRIGNPVGKSESRQELYFLSNEEIKEGDWCLELGFNRIFQAEKESLSQDYIKNCKKIIATTDLLLEIKYDGLKSISEKCGKKLPQPSQSFIQAFFKAYNEGKPITKVLVEYTSTADRAIDWEQRDIIKINSSNEITIKKIKDNYTREEISQMLADFLTDCWNKDYQFNGLAHDEVANNWIEENL